MKAPIILDLCGGTGSWTKPYVGAGYDVRVIDLKRGQDVRLFTPPKKVFGVLVAPPCRYLSKVGNRWWSKWGDEKLLEALSIVDACLRIVVTCNPNWWVLENPVGRLHRYLGKPRMYFHPYEYGDPYKKKTCLWGNFNPPGKWRPIQPINSKSNANAIDAYIQHVKGEKLTKEERSSLRSITPPNFAKAFFEANQHLTFKFKEVKTPIPPTPKGVGILGEFL